MVTKYWFSISIIPHTFTSKEEISLLPTYLFLWIHGFLFYTIGYTPLLLFIFMFKLFQIWPIGASSRWSYSNFCYAPIIR